MHPSLYNQQLFDFLARATTPFHAVAEMVSYLCDHGFSQLRENEPWTLQAGRSYLVTREQGAMIAFRLGDDHDRSRGFRMLAAHTDSPGLQIKPCPDLQTATYHQLGVEVYGGSLLGPWFDRDLSLAGRVVCTLSDQSLSMLLVDFQRPLLTIPSLAIHFNREANSGSTINPHKHLPPIIAQSVSSQLPKFKFLLLDQLRHQYPALSIEEVLAYDMFCYDSQPPAYLGISRELISSARLDNLLSCHAAMTALADADSSSNCLLFCANHEENGSTSATGAHGSMIDSVVERLLPDSEKRRISLCNSFLVSMDNAHAAHPNHPDKMDAAHEIHLNQGPVIKFNANQRYASSSLTAALFKQICQEAKIPCQEFVMRSDLACGSTIGPITAARLGVRTVDIGAPSLAMHSIRELTGSTDPFLLYRSGVQFFNSDGFARYRL